MERVYRIEQLYSKDEKPKTISMETEETVDVNDIGPDILNNEVEISICNLKNGKAEG